MTRSTSLVGAVAGAALVLAVPAWGKAQLGQDFWNYDSQTGAKVADTSPGISSQDLGSLYGGEVSDRVAPIGSPDLVDRALAARQREQAVMLDARERSASERPAGTIISSVDARERSFGAKLQAQLGTGSSPDVVQRAVDARGGSIIEPVRDDRFRIDPTSGPSPVSVTSGRDLEWPQLGVGFVVGLLLAMGLYLTVRLTRIRPLAH
jgi:hypothetical protein